MVLMYLRATMNIYWFGKWRAEWGMFWSSFTRLWIFMKSECQIRFPILGIWKLCTRWIGQDDLLGWIYISIVDVHQTDWWQVLNINQNLKWFMSSRANSTPRAVFTMKRLEKWLIISFHKDRTFFSIVASSWSCPFQSTRKSAPKKIF